MSTDGAALKPRSGTMTKSDQTRERILSHALALFNEQGEHRVSTNHIAAAAGLSPGNLYYHFSGKGAILEALLTRYHGEILNAMAFPKRPLELEDKLIYFRQVNTVLCRYGFIHKALGQLIETYPSLLEQYRPFAQDVLHQGRLIYQKFVEAGLMSATPAELDALIINVWIVLSNWGTYISLSGMNQTERGARQTEDGDWIHQGIRQVLMLQMPYATPQARPMYDALLQEFGR